MLKPNHQYNTHHLRAGLFHRRVTRMSRGKVVVVQQEVVVLRQGCT
jgi:hypothetical protein